MFSDSAKRIPLFAEVWLSPKEFVSLALPLTGRPCLLVPWDDYQQQDACLGEREKQTSRNLFTRAGDHARIEPFPETKTYSSQNNESLGRLF